jgi:hypothetical protein
MPRILSGMRGTTSGQFLVPWFPLGIGYADKQGELNAGGDQFHFLAVQTPA